MYILVKNVRICNKQPYKICKIPIFFVSLYAVNCAPMNSLFLLIALYTISGKQATASGEVPSGSTCEYVQTGNQSGQMTAGNEITLTLSGYDALQLQSVTLSMKSNTSAGSGEMQLKVGETEVWRIADAPFSSADWAGAYSKDWVNISHSLGGLVVPDDAPIVLHIKASKNSLYLQSVAVEYIGGQTEKYTVSFRTYSSQQVEPITESQANAGVVLPDVAVSDASWQFYGWASAPVDNQDKQPAVYVAGATYYPSADCTLHAVYVQHDEPQPWWPTDDLSLGDYLIGLYEPVNSYMYVATGGVTNGMLATVNRSVTSTDGWAAMSTISATEANIYTLDVKDDTLTIRHKATNSAVLMGGNGKFAKTSSANNAWIISPQEVETDAMPHYSISSEVGGKTYYFSFNLVSDDVYFCPQTDQTRQHDLLLYALSDIQDITWQYSSYAFGSGVQNTYQENTSTYRMPVGPYMLIIKNGKKYLQINE